MGLIKKMPPHLANMIAAGEVVERPSSVVKELIENSIDAKAKNIIIYLENGGLDLIKVVDDGVGMDSDDVTLAFQPHATSKIKTEYDLFRINTLGFRGEAIASIAAVSECEIISSTDGVMGFHQVYKYGAMGENGIINSNKGTTVTVKKLFFNTPARLKYMKSAKSELSSIMFYIDRIAMSKVDLRFSVYSDNKLVFSTSGSNSYESLVGEVYGLDAAKNVITKSYVSDGYRATLVLIKPQIYRSSKLEITMICNERYVKNFNITNAVCDAYNTYIPIGKYPIAILYFSIDSTLVDVNVHPRKTEIKIANEEAICNKLRDEIKEALKEVNHIPVRNINNNEASKKTSIFDNIINNLDEDIKYEPKKEINNNLEFNEPKKPIYNDRSKYTNKVELNTNIEIDKKINEEFKPEEIIRKKIPYMEYVGTVFGTYLIFQNSLGMYLIDQHAAAERINYEKYYKIIGNPNQPTCDLLIPSVIEFTKQEAIFVLENINKFSEIGFLLDQIGETSFAVRRVPLWAKIDEIDELLYEIIERMVENRKIDVIEFRDHIAKSISCKASIKANHFISRLEIDSLLNQLEKCENPYTCPHGRPTIIKITLEDIEKMFERIQK